MPHPGSWTVVSTEFLTVLACVTALTWLAVLRRPRRSRAMLRRCLGAALAITLTLTLVADGFNSYYSYLPNVSDVVDAVTHRPPPPLVSATRNSRRSARVRGQLLTLRIPDDGSKFGPTRAWVWLPPQYFSDPTIRLPVVYLFHGSPGMQKDWFHGGAADSVGRELASRSVPVIEVAPQMSRGWLDDPECVDGIQERVETHLLQDVIPTVDRSLRTIADRTGRIFAGMSAGGYCALNLGLRHRDVVATILDYSGFTGPTHQGGLTALFGKLDPGASASNTPATYAGLLRSGPAMRIWLDCGTADHDVLRQMTAILPVLRGDGMTAELHTRPGNHTYTVWRAALKNSLRWALTG